jgi:hypothetical protein
MAKILRQHREAMPAQSAAQVERALAEGQLRADKERATICQLREGAARLT